MIRASSRTALGEPFGFPVPFWVRSTRGPSGKPEITHACPPGAEIFMPCCGLTPFDVSRWDRITLDPELVTCSPNPS